MEYVTNYEILNKITSLEKEIDELKKQCAECKYKQTLFKRILRRFIKCLN